MNTVSKFLGAVDRALNGPTPKLGPEHAAGVVVSRALPGIKEAMGPRFAEAGNLFRHMEKLNHDKNFRYTDQAGAARYNQQMAAHRDHAHTGGCLLECESAAKSFEAHRSEMAVLRDGASAAIMQNAEAFKPLRDEICTLLLASLDAEVQEIEQTERATAETFCVAYVPSATIAQLRDLTPLLTNRAANLIFTNGI